MPSKQVKNREDPECHTKTRPILDLTRTAVRHLEQFKTRPWDAIPSLRNHIPEYGIALPYDQYDEIAENVWMHVSAYLSPTARIEGPAIIGGGAEIRHFSYIKTRSSGLSPRWANSPPSKTASSLTAPPYAGTMRCFPP